MPVLLPALPGFRTESRAQGGSGHTGTGAHWAEAAGRGLWSKDGKEAGLGDPRAGEGWRKSVQIPQMPTAQGTGREDRVAVPRAARQAAGVWGHWPPELPPRSRSVESRRCPPILSSFHVETACPLRSHPGLGRSGARPAGVQAHQSSLETAFPEAFCLVSRRLGAAVWGGAAWG